MIIRLFLGVVAGLWCATVLAISSSDGKKVADLAFPIPDKYQLVNDYLGVFQISKAIEVTKKLQALEKQNGSQIVFLSVPSIGNDELKDYAIKVANKWDIGNSGQGNGVLFLVSQSDGLYILTGPGISGALPDVKIARIIREIVTPKFEQEKYSEGIEAAIDAMIKAARGEDTASTFYYYLDATGAYFSPALTYYDRLKLSITREQVMIGVLVIFGIIYAALLFWHRQRQKKEAA